MVNAWRPPGSGRTGAYTGRHYDNTLDANIVNENSAENTVVGSLGSDNPLEFSFVLMDSAAGRFKIVEVSPGVFSSRS